MRTILFFLFTIVAGYVYGQPTRPVDYGLKAFRIQDKQWGEINCYVTTQGIDSVKPLLIALDGSGPYPLTTYVQLRNKKARIMNTFDNDILQLADRFHVVLISKPGIPFCDTLAIDKDDVDGHEVMDSTPFPLAYKQRATLQWRAGAASAVIDYLWQKLPVNRKKIIVYGYSEGGQVVPKLALINRKVTHCASIVGGGLNQFYDFLTAQRLLAAKGEITHQEAQRRIDSLLKQFADIYSHPQAIDKEWEGHAYRRWASYATTIALESLVKLNIPIFMAAGSQDVNSPVFGLDYVPLEFLRLGKRNLTFKVYPTDHFFNEIKYIDGKEEVINHKPAMIQDLLHWLDQ